jgi:hypothetical protein
MKIHLSFLGKTFPLLSLSSFLLHFLLLRVLCTLFIFVRAFFNEPGVWSAREICSVELGAVSLLPQMILLNKSNLARIREMNLLAFVLKVQLISPFPLSLARVSIIWARSGVLHYLYEWEKA